MYPPIGVSSKCRGKGNRENVLFWPANEYHRQPEIVKHPNKNNIVPLVLGGGEERGEFFFFFHSRLTANLRRRNSFENNFRAHVQQDIFTIANNNVCDYCALSHLDTETPSTNNNCVHQYLSVRYRHLYILIRIRDVRASRRTAEGWLKRSWIGINQSLFPSPLLTHDYYACDGSDQWRHSGGGPTG